MQNRNLQLERLVFFCDAVVAIAITLLALDLKVESPADGHLSFSDITSHWKTFAAFLLSFINIANFWKTHHTFFSYIKKIDERILWYNILWLFFIVLLPFSTSLVSAYFHDTAAIFTYSLNIFLIACFQNMLWDYPSARSEYIKEDAIDNRTMWEIRLFCNLDMINALLSIVLSFFKPELAFIFLFTKLPMLVLARIYYVKRIRQHRKQKSKPAAGETNDNEKG